MQTQTPDQTSPDRERYHPDHLSHVTQTHTNGRVDLEIRLYLPQISGSRLLKKGDVQIKLGLGGWRDLYPPTPNQPCWFLNLDQIRPDTGLQFRFRNGRGKWQPIAPLAAMDRVQQVYYCPQLDYVWQHEPPPFKRAKVLMETTLEGLLAGYEGGVFAPRSREELFRNPIARQILRTDIPYRLEELGIDQIMVATTSAVADRSYLNPRFNYLTFDVGDVDWQLGSSHQFMQLLDALYGVGISLVPDLTFAHQVRAPFPGSLDQVDEEDSTEKRFEHVEAFKSRDFGTWMFKLEDPLLRKQIIEKITSFVLRYRLKLIRLGYLDGVLQQYSNHEINYGEIFLQELRSELQHHSPETRLLGEALKTRSHPKLKDCIDICYASYGFPILEEICRPPELRRDPLIPEFDRLIPALQQAIASERLNAVYAQLHDELYQNNYISEDRPDTPWAYGGNPAELFKVQGEKLVKRGLLPKEDLLDYIRRSVRSVEALTLFITNLIYMFSPGVDSLMLGCSEAPGNWKFHWDDVAPEQLEFWGKAGLSDRQIYLLHKQHRLDMARLRQIFRDYTHIEPNTLKPKTQIHIHQVDTEKSLVSLWRFNPTRSAESLLVAFNLGPRAFKEKNDQPIELPIPDGFDQNWEVLFDGDWMDPLLETSDTQYYLDENVDVVAYAPGTILPTENKEGKKIIRLELGAYSLIVLKVYRLADQS